MGASSRTDYQHAFACEKGRHCRRAAALAVPAVRGDVALGPGAADRNRPDIPRQTFLQESIEAGPYGCAADARYIGCDGETERRRHGERRARRDGDLEG